MKYLGYWEHLLFLALVLLLNYPALAQNKENKWSVGLGVNAIDFRKVMYIKGFVDDYFDVSHDINMNFVPVRVSVDYTLNKKFTLQFSSAFNEVQKCKLYGICESEHNQLFLAMDTQLKYDLNHFLGETGWFDPFVLIGTGYVHIGDFNTFNITGGYGFNTWYSEGIGFYFHSTYNHHTGLSPTDYFMHSIGVVVQLNKLSNSF